MEQHRTVESRGSFIQEEEKLKSKMEMHLEIASYSLPEF